MDLKPLITILVGPPGSGKSTWCDEYFKTHRNRDDLIRISQDDLGKQGHMYAFKQALELRRDIVIDRMNFDVGQRRRYLDPAKKAGYDTRIVVLHVPEKVCMDRCRDRKNHPTIKTEEDVQNAVTFFFRKYERVQDTEVDEVLRTGWVDSDAQKCVVCDIDGTIADVTHRKHYVRCEKPLKPNWYMFFERMIDDPVNQWCRALLEHMSTDYPIVYATGRPGNYMKYTKEWLEKHDLHLPKAEWPTLLFSRQAKDHRKDDIVKEIILEFEIKTRFNILFVVDDRQQVVDMWRKHGNVVLQCAKGNF